MNTTNRVTPTIAANVSAMIVGVVHSTRGADFSTVRRRDREYYAPERSRLRCRDIMTRDLVVATRDTTLPEVALMMKQEDTGVIPVVEYDAQSGNGKTEVAERNYEDRNYARGKLIGLITDRDIVVRAVADNKDCASVRAEDIMSVDIYTAKPNDRVVDVIRKMGDKQVRRIPVCNDNGYLVGMISMADIALETRRIASSPRLSKRSRRDRRSGTGSLVNLVSATDLHGKHGSEPCHPCRICGETFFFPLFSRHAKHRS